MSGPLQNLPQSTDLDLLQKQLINTSWLYDGRTSYAKYDLALVLNGTTYELWMYNGDTRLTNILPSQAARAAPTEGAENNWVQVTANSSGFTITTGDPNSHTFLTPPVNGDLAFNRLYGTWWEYETQSTPALSRWIRLGSRTLFDAEDVDALSFSTDTGSNLMSAVDHADGNETILTLDQTPGYTISSNQWLFLVGSDGTTFEGPFEVLSASGTTINILGAYGGHLVTGTEANVWIANSDLFMSWDPTTNRWVGVAGGEAGDFVTEAEFNAYEEQITAQLTRNPSDSESYYQFSGTPEAFTETADNEQATVLAFDDDFSAFQELVRSGQLQGNPAVNFSTKVTLRNGTADAAFKEYLVVGAQSGYFYVADENTVAAYRLEHIEDGYHFYSAASSGATNGGITGLYESKLWLGNSLGGIVEIPHGSLFDSNGNLAGRTLPRTTGQGISDYYAVRYLAPGDNSPITGLDFYFQSPSNSALIAGNRNGRVFRVRDGDSATISFDEGGIVQEEMGDYTTPTSATFTTAKFNIRGIKSFTLDGAIEGVGDNYPTMDNGSRMYVIFGDTAEAKSPGDPIPGIAIANNLHSLTPAQFVATGVARVPGGNDPSEQYVAYGDGAGETLYDDELNMTVYDVDYYSDSSDNQYLLIVGEQNDTDAPAEQAQMFYCDFDARSPWQPERLPANGYKAGLGSPIYSASHGPALTETGENGVWLSTGNGAVWSLPDDVTSLGNQVTYSNAALLQARANPSDSSSDPITTGNIIGFDVFGITAGTYASVYAAGVSTDGHVVRWDLQPDITVTVRYKGVNYVSTYNFQGSATNARAHFASAANYTPALNSEITIATDAPTDEPAGQLYIDFSVATGNPLPGITISHGGAFIATDSAFAQNQPWRVFSETATSVTVRIPDGNFVFTTVLSSAIEDATAERAVQQVRDTINHSATGITAELLDQDFNPVITDETPVLQINQPGVHAFSNRPVISIENAGDGAAARTISGSFGVNSVGHLILVDVLLNGTAPTVSVPLTLPSGTVFMNADGSFVATTLTEETLTTDSAAYDPSTYSSTGTAPAVGTTVPFVDIATGGGGALMVADFADGAFDTIGAEGGLFNPNDYYTKPQIDAKIDAIESIPEGVTAVAANPGVDPDNTNLESITIGAVNYNVGNVTDVELAGVTVYNADLLQLYPAGAVVHLNGLIYERNSFVPAEGTLVVAPNLDTTTATGTGNIGHEGTYWILEGSTGASHEWHMGDHYVEGDVVVYNHIIYVAAQESGPGTTGGVQQPSLVGSTQNVHFGAGTPGANDYWEVSQSTVNVGEYDENSDTFLDRGDALVLGFRVDQFDVSTINSDTGLTHIEMTAGAITSVASNVADDTWKTSQVSGLDEALLASGFHIHEGWVGHFSAALDGDGNYIVGTSAFEHNTGSIKQTLSYDPGAAAISAVIPEIPQGDGSQYLIKMDVQNGVAVYAIDLHSTDATALPTAARGFDIELLEFQGDTPTATIGTDSATARPFALLTEVRPVVQTVNVDSNWKDRSAMVRAADTGTAAAVSAVEEATNDIWSMVSTTAGNIESVQVNSIVLPDRDLSGNILYDDDGNVRTTRYIFPGGDTADPPGQPTASATVGSITQFAGDDDLVATFNVSEPASEWFTQANAATINGGVIATGDLEVEYRDINGDVQENLSGNNVTTIVLTQTAQDQVVGSFILRLNAIRVANAATASYEPPIDQLDVTVSVTAAVKPIVTFSLQNDTFNQFDTVGDGVPGAEPEPAIRLNFTTAGTAGGVVTNFDDLNDGTVAPTATSNGASLLIGPVSQIGSPWPLSWGISGSQVQAAVNAANNITVSNPLVSAQTTGSDSIDQTFPAGSLTRTVTVNRLPRGITSTRTAPSSGLVSIYDTSGENLQISWNHALTNVDPNGTYDLGFIRANGTTGEISLSAGQVSATTGSVSYRTLGYSLADGATRTGTASVSAEYDDTRDDYYDVAVGDGDNSPATLQFFLPYYMIVENDGNFFLPNGTALTGITSTEVSTLDVPDINQDLEAASMGEALTSAMFASTSNPHTVTYSSSYTGPATIWLLAPSHTYPTTDAKFVKFVASGMDLPGSVNIASYGNAVKLPPNSGSSEQGLPDTVSDTYNQWNLGAITETTSFRISDST